jgi:hypothetical protein
VREYYNAPAFQVCKQQSDLTVHAALAVQTQRVSGYGIDRAAKNSRDVFLRVAAAKQILYL